MSKVNLNYLKLTAGFTLLAITFIGLSGLLSMTTTAQERVILQPREIDLRKKIGEKKFADGRRVEVDALAGGEKIVAEIKNGEFLNWFLVTADGKEVQGEVRRKKGSTTVVCTSIMVVVTETVVNGQTVKTEKTTIIQIPCPPKFANLAS